MLAFLVAARFADPIVSLQPYQFASYLSRRRNRERALTKGMSPTKIWKGTPQSEAKARSSKALQRYFFCMKTAFYGRIVFGASAVLSVSAH